MARTCPQGAGTMIQDQCLAGTSWAKSGNEQE